MPERTYDSQAEDTRQVDENGLAENQTEEAETFQTYPSVPEGDDPGPPTGGG